MVHLLHRLYGVDTPGCSKNIIKCNFTRSLANSNKDIFRVLKRTRDKNVTHNAPRSVNARKEMFSLFANNNNKQICIAP